MKKAHVTHPELKCTFCLEIIGVKKNPNGQTYTALGVITKGTIIEVQHALQALCNCMQWRRVSCVVLQKACCSRPLIVRPAEN